VPDSIVQSSAERFFQYGVLGILVVIFGFVIGYLYREWSKERKELLSDFSNERKLYEGEIKQLNAAMVLLQKDHIVALQALQTVRSDEGKIYAEKLLDINKSNAVSMATVSSFLDRTQETLADVRETMKEVGDDIRRRP
jgi:hypothetical protein